MAYSIEIEGDGPIPSPSALTYVMGLAQHASLKYPKNPYEAIMFIEYTLTEVVRASKPVISFQDFEVEINMGKKIILNHRHGYNITVTLS